MSFATALGAVSTGLNILGKFKGPNIQSGTSTNTTQNKFLQEANFKNLLDRAEALYGEQYGPEFIDALNQERYRLSRGEGLSQQAVGTLQRLLGPDSAITKTAEGVYLDPDSQEYKDRYELATRGFREQFTDTIMPQLNNQAMTAGRWGSPAQQRQVNQAGKVLGQQLADANIKLAEQERNRQMAAIKAQASLAGQLGKYQGATANRLQQIDPRSIEAGKLGQFKELIGGSMGNTSTSAAPYTRTTPNKYTQLGGALGGGADFLNQWNTSSWSDWSPGTGFRNTPSSGYGTLGGF